MPRILIADDHEVMRLGLRDILQSRPGWQICAEASTGREAVALAAEHKPEVVVIDFSMPDLNGLEATRQILQQSPSTQVLILTMHESEQLVRRALLAGARGFILKSDAGRILVTAVDHLCRRRPYFSQKVTQMLWKDFQDNPEGPSGKGDPLTSREREIVQLIAEGLTSKEIAARLDISLKTAETHRANIMRKLRVHSVSEVVRYALRAGLAAL